MDDLDQLRELSADLAAAQASEWEPRCVARTFARRNHDALRFTMQAWIDLELVKSPLLQLELPTENEDEVFLDAVDAFALPLPRPHETDADNAVLIMQGMIAEIRDAFAMGLKVRAPQADDATTPPAGMGDWLPTLACLIVQIGLSRDEALDLPVGEAFALIPAHRVNQGWSVISETYREREALREVPRG